MTVLARPSRRETVTEEETLTTDDMWAGIEAINTWLDTGEQTPHEDAMRVMKIGEEYGEAVAAYIGMTGQNPRKGVTHSQADLLAELADVAITALCAMQHFTGDLAVTRAHLAAKVTGVRARIEAPSGRR